MRKIALRSKKLARAKQTSGGRGLKVVSNR